MMKWMFACAVVAAIGFSADSANAQEPISGPAKAITSSDSASAVQDRTGLFRIRRFRSDLVRVTPSTTTTTPAPVVVPTPSTETGPFQRQGLLARLRIRR